MNKKYPTTQLQVRIDKDTKEEAKKILEEIGLDLSTAIKMLFKQIIQTRTLPLEIRDANGFRPHKAAELREAMKEAEQSKTYTSVEALFKDLLA